MTHTATPQALLSATARFAAAAGVAVLLALATLGAESASRDAVDSAQASFAQAPLTATLPRVEIVGKRAVASAATAS